jgi:hypothetical protein
MNLFDNDSDNDGLLDNVEFSLFTNPISSDTDNDGLNDYEEVNTYNTDPTKADSDGDGISDADEIDQGTDPLDANSPVTTTPTSSTSTSTSTTPDSFNDILPFVILIPIIGLSLVSVIFRDNIRFFLQNRFKKKED